MEDKILFGRTSPRMPRQRANLPDWLVGARGKRRLLEALVHEPGRAWNQTQLAAASGLGKHGSVDEHLAALVQSGVVVDANGVFTLDQASALVEPLRRVLAAWGSLPDEPVRKP
jgi:hypothetical protein